MTLRSILLAGAAALAAAPALAQSCARVVFSDVGWTDITATTAV
ncbi:MAG TPA: glycine/betaine ABC transporter substrate-binding protein, partial [Paracoccaceae bacterium]|nr:glycine/betaine ABC transporter substrate-binding protein [Paracoccaceae bacterium]